jgi:PAS domain-containing protein
MRLFEVGRNHEWGALRMGVLLRERAIRWILIWIWVPVLVVPSLFLHRVMEVRDEGRAWAHGAQWGEKLRRVSVCDKGNDLGAWSHMMGGWNHMLDEFPGHFLSHKDWQPELERSQKELQRLGAVSSVRRADMESLCWRLRGFGEHVLAASIAAGGDTQSRPDRPEDKALRDGVTLMVLGFAFVVAALIRLRFVLLEQGRHRASDIHRILDGIQAAKGASQGGDMDEALQRLGHMVKDDKTHLVRMQEHLRQMRRMLRQALSLFDEPVLIVAVGGKLQYANDAAAKAFGEQVVGLEGCPLSSVKGGEALRRLVDAILEHAANGDSACLPEVDLVKETRLKKWRIVRDHEHHPARVLMVFDYRDGAWWSQLWS